MLTVVSIELMKEGSNRAINIQSVNFKILILYLTIVEPHLRIFSLAARKTLLLHKKEGINLSRITLLELIGD